MRVLVTGKGGQLGRSIYKALYTSKGEKRYIQSINEFIFVGREELDLSQNESVSNYFKHNKFDVIINCAAYTAVDNAEEEHKLAKQINYLAVKQLAEIANKQQAKLIHISTDYVFDGNGHKPYLESDKTNPINVYGKTKLAGDLILQEIMPTNSIIIRPSWVHSEYGNNFVKTMLRLGKEKRQLNVVNDQMGSPTYATDLASVILEILQNKIFKEKKFTAGVYHYSNRGGISWHKFAEKIFEIGKVDCKVNPVKTNQYPTSAKRPKNTVMDIDKIVNTFDIDIIDWVDAVQVCIKNIKDKT